MSEDIIKEMFAAGAHFGYSRTRNHPSTRSFIFGYKNRSAVIDLAKTREQLELAKDFLRQLASEGKQILFVGNKDEAKHVVRQAAEGLGMPHVSIRWLGGTLTNFPQLKNRVEKLQELKNGRDTGAWLEYTKKERLMMERKIARLERYFSTLVSLSRLPAALVVVDSKEEETAISEAKALGLPIVSLSNTDCDLRGIDFPIVANDGSVASIKFFVEQLAGAYEEGKRMVAVSPEPMMAAS